MPFYPKYTQKDVEEIIQKNGCELISPYSKAKEKIKIKCKCGNEFETTFEKFMSRNKRQCNRCGIKRRTDLDRLTKEQVNKIVNDLGYSIVQENYTTYKDYFVVRCRCGFVFETNIPKLRNSQFACPKCRHERMVEINSRYTADAISSLLEENGSKLVSNIKGYIGTKSKIIFNCSKCGNSVKTSLGYVLKNRKYLCNSCAYTGKSKSYGEILVKNILDAMGLDYKREYSFPDCKYKNKLRFDFAVIINERIFLIEFDGLQHYQEGTSGFFSSLEENTIRDKIKDNYCLEKGIPLLRIRYDETKWIENKIRTFLNIW